MKQRINISEFKVLLSERMTAVLNQKQKTVRDDLDIIAAICGPIFGMLEEGESLDEDIHTLFNNVGVLNSKQAQEERITTSEFIRNRHYNRIFPAWRRPGQ